MFPWLTHCWVNAFGKATVRTDVPPDDIGLLQSSPAPINAIRPPVLL